MQTEKQSEPVMRKPAYYITNPLKVGTVNKEGAEEIKIISINDDVTVYAGTFNNCVKVEAISKNKQKQLIWYAENIGEVKRIIQRPDHMKTISQLKK